MDTYGRLFKTKRFVGAQPITFNRQTYIKGKAYYLTHKLDGERRLLIINSSSSKLISSKLNFTKFNIPYRKGLKNTVLDGELFLGKFYVFDILYYKGKDTRNIKLTNRLEILDKAIKEIKSKKVIPKEYLSPYENTVCKNFFKLKRKYAGAVKKGTVDGIIFTPDEPYKTAISLKWKPTNILSIDFKIKKLGNNTVALLNQNNEVFIPPIEEYKGIGITRITNYDKYEDNSIVEFIFKNGRFVPIRERKDKVMSNHINVILSNLDSIINPPDMKKLLC